MANHIAEVAHVLGVKIGETFKLTDDTHGDYHQYYQFTDKKGFETSLDGVKWKTAAAEVLKDILMDEKYYSPSIFDWDFYKYNFWLNDECDEKYYKRGLVFKTKEEAIKMSKKMLAMAKERGNLA